MLKQVEQVSGKASADVMGSEYVDTQVERELSVEEVDAKFAEIVAEIDHEVTPEDEERLNKVYMFKQSGSAQPLVRMTRL